MESSALVTSTDPAANCASPHPITAEKSRSPSPSPSPSPSLDRRRSRSNSRSNSSRRNRRRRSTDRRRSASSTSSSSSSRSREQSRRRRRVDDTSDTIIASHSGAPLLDACCVRLGVFLPKVPVTREQVIDEMDAIKMTNRVDTVVVEQSHIHGHYWARIYFPSPDVADLCATELNIPRRASKWRHFVTQRLPLLGPMCGECFTIPAFEPLRADPVDSVVIGTDEGFTFFSTEELYRTEGAVEYLTAKQSGRVISRTVCNQFDSTRYQTCKFGVRCNFIHVKAMAMWKLLRPTTLRAPLKVLPLKEQASEKENALCATANASANISLWEFGRRYDTLVVRYLEPERTLETLQFMFGGCRGFLNCSIQSTKDGKRFGFVQFVSAGDAFDALAQTFDSNLNVSFYGVLEDMRRLVSAATSLPPSFKRTIAIDNASALALLSSTGCAPHGDAAPVADAVDSSETSLRPETHFRGAAPSVTAVACTSTGGGGGGCSPKQTVDGSTEIPGDAIAPVDNAASKALPFPSLPEGWEHGYSRRTNQYYFFQPKTKNSTTWKHPVTGERYSN